MYEREELGAGKISQPDLNQVYIKFIFGMTFANLEAVWAPAMNFIMTNLLTLVSKLFPGRNGKSGHRIMFMGDTEFLYNSITSLFDLRIDPAV